MPKAFFIDTTKCTACRGCQVGCKEWKNFPAVPTKQRGTHQNPPDLTHYNFKLVRFAEHMYRVSPPHLRSLNANLLLVAVDAGFILGPLVGGQALAAGLPLAGLFALCGGLFACACFLVLPVGRLTPAQPGKA